MTNCHMMRHFTCVFLYNPQNLDIRSIADGKMILIATQSAAIHTRLWCVFEAYTAMERGFATEVEGDLRVSDEEMQVQLLRWP